jgi:hypothetical protein
LYHLFSSISITEEQGEADEARSKVFFALRAQR